MKGVAIGDVRRGARLSGERTLSIPPSCNDPVSHAGGPHVASFVVDRSCMWVRAGAGVCVRENGRPKRGRVRVRARKRPAKKRVGTMKKKRGLHARAEATAGGGSGI